MSRTTGGNTTNYVWDVAAGLPAILQDGTNTYVYGLGLISTYDGSAMTYRHHRWPRLHDQPLRRHGQRAGRLRYDVFGAIRSQTGSSSNYWKFTGEQRDSESGFDYLRARYYDPEAGRLISDDPITAGYVYASSNPANSTDPTGLYPFGGMTTSDFCLYGEGDSCVRSYTFTGEIDLFGNVTDFHITSVGLQSGEVLGPEDPVACYGQGSKRLCSLPDGSVIDSSDRTIGSLHCGGWDYLDHGCDVAVTCLGDGGDCDAKFGFGAEVKCLRFYCAPTNACPYSQCFESMNPAAACVFGAAISTGLTIITSGAATVTLVATARACAAGIIGAGLREIF